MELEILYFGKLRDLSGGKTREIVTVDGNVEDIKSLIKELEEKHGSEFAEALAATKGLRILVNGREYQLLNGMDTKLKDKDTVVLLPPIFGG
jgi:MoaD family protein